MLITAGLTKDKNGQKNEFSSLKSKIIKTLFNISHNHLHKTPVPSYVLFHVRTC